MRFEAGEANDGARRRRGRPVALESEAGSYCAADSGDVKA